LLAGAQSAAAQEEEESATIQGLVVDSRGAPASDVCIFASRTGPEPNFAWDAMTGADGRYSLSVYPGEYRIQASTCGGGPSVSVFYPDHLDPPGDTVHVGDGETFIANMRLPAVPRISGRITDQFGRPVEGACPKAIGHPDPNDVSWMAGKTGPDGRYELSGLRPNRSYKVAIYECEAFPQRFAETWWHGADAASAEPIAIAEADRTDVDFQITVGGQIAGRVVNELGEPLSWVCAEAVGPDGAKPLAMSGADGYFRSGGVPQGEYRIYFKPCGHPMMQPNSAGYAPEYWDDVPTAETADPVALGNGDTPVLNVELTHDGPEPCTVPEVKGKRVRRASRLLTRADCGVGPLAGVPEARPRDRVVASKPREGATRRHLARVKLKVAPRD
jgi:hypothetical protein